MKNPTSSICFLQQDMAMQPRLTSNSSHPTPQMLDTHPDA